MGWCHRVMYISARLKVEKRDPNLKDWERKLAASGYIPEPLLARDSNFFIPGLRAVVLKVRKQLTQARLENAKFTIHDPSTVMYDILDGFNNNADKTSGLV